MIFLIACTVISLLTSSVLICDGRAASFSERYVMDSKGFYAGNPLHKLQRQTVKNMGPLFKSKYTRAADYVKSPYSSSGEVTDSSELRATGNKVHTQTISMPAAFVRSGGVMVVQERPNNIAQAHNKKLADQLSTVQHQQGTPHGASPVFYQIQARPIWKPMDDTLEIKTVPNHPYTYTIAPAYKYTRKFLWRE